ncbi:MAG: A24 family peptidase [Phycisphaerae bacterium]|nr:A24 family peptidase [Phycisphaerae bacterium]
MKTVWVADAVLAATLLIAVVTDLARGRIYNWLTYPAVLAGLAVWAVGGYVAGGWGGAAMGLLGSWAGMLVAFVPMMFAFYLGGIGGGDAKLAAAIGALALWKLAIYALFYGFIIAAILALPVMIYRRVVRQTMGRVWKFLWLLATGARPASPTDARSPQIATALPWALGTLWAMTEMHLLGGWSVIDWLIGK